MWTNLYLGVGDTEHALYEAIMLCGLENRIYHELTEAVVAFQKNVREQWIFDPPAQVTYLVCNLLHHSL